MRFGFAAHPADPGAAVAQARRAEAAGLDSFWLVDNVAPAGSPDALTALAAIAAVTDRIMLAPGVTDPVRRDLALLAQTAATIDQLAEGRFVLTLGAGYRGNLAPYGRPADRLLDRLEEAVAVLRKLQGASAVDHDSDFTQLSGARVGVRPHGGRLPIWLGLTAGRGLELTGRLADGWYPLGQTPSSYAAALAKVRSAAAAAGRDPEAIEPALVTHLSCGEDREQAREAVLDEARRYMLYSPGTLAQHGVEMPEGAKSATRWAGEEGDFSAAIPADLALQAVVAGTPAECAEQIEAFGRAGVRHLVLSGSNHEGAEAEGFFERAWPQVRAQLATTTDSEERHAN